MKLKNRCQSRVCSKCTEVFFFLFFLHLSRIFSVQRSRLCDCSHHGLMCQPVGCPSPLLFPPFQVQIKKARTDRKEGINTSGRDASFTTQQLSATPGVVEIKHNESEGRKSQDSGMWQRIMSSRGAAQIMQELPQNLLLCWSKGIIETVCVSVCVS